MLYVCGQSPSITTSVTLTSTPLQLSVAAGMSVGKSAVQLNTTSLNVSSTGAWLSTTVMVCCPVATFKQGSMALKVRTRV